MKAVVCKALEGIDALSVEDIARATPGPREVVVAVRAVGLNFFDTLITRGAYQFKPQLPFSPGGEICGTVIASGEGVSGFAIGTRVMAYLGWGGAREQVVVPASALIRVPDGVSDEVAAGLGITYGTAMHGLIERGNLRPGETVAVLGAAGGAGLAAIEIAKMLGARVIGVASGETKLQTCLDAGADEVFDYDAGNLKGGLKALTGGDGVDVVYDCVGGDMSEPAVRAMAWKGRFLVVGFASGTIPKLALNLLLVKGCSAVGVFWGDAVKRDPSGHRANMTKLLAWVAEGRIKPLVGATFALDEAREALQVISQRKARGKIVLTVG